MIVIGLLKNPGKQGILSAGHQNHSEVKRYRNETLPKGRSNLEPHRQVKRYPMIPNVADRDAGEEEPSLLGGQHCIWRIRLRSHNEGQRIEAERNRSALPMVPLNRCRRELENS